MELIYGIQVWLLRFSYKLIFYIIEDLSEENLLPAESQRNDRYVGLVCLHYPHILAQEWIQIFKTILLICE